MGKKERKMMSQPVVEKSEQFAELIWWPNMAAPFCHFMLGSLRIQKLYSYWSEGWPGSSAVK